MKRPIRWPAEAIWQAVAPQLPGFTVEVLPRIDSTNTELMRRARAGRCEPTLLVAEQQTAGRGRLGRDWHSGLEGVPADTGGDLPSLTFSLGMPLAPGSWSGLSLAVGVSVAESLQPLPPPASSPIPRIGLKWPNDLWLASSAGERKLGGILVETASFMAPQGADWSTHGSVQRYVVVGVGLNVWPRTGGASLSLPPGCLHEVDEQLDAPAALARVVAPLVTMLQMFATYGFAPLQARFDLRDVLKNRDVVLSDGSSGTAHGVAPDGALRVHTAQGMQSITSSDISVRPASAAANLSRH